MEALALEVVMSLWKRALTAEELAQLEQWSRSQRAEARLVRRAKMVLGASRHNSTCDAVRATGVERHTLQKWIARFLEYGIEGLHDESRCGRPPTYTPAEIARVIATSLTNPRDLGLPFGEWTQVRLADYLHTVGIGISASRVGEVLRAEGLRWHTQESWFGKGEVVNPDFAEKRGASSGLTALRQKVR